MKLHKLPHLTCDVTRQHYRPGLSDVSLLSERTQGAAEIQAKSHMLRLLCLAQCDIYKDQIYNVLLKTGSLDNAIREFSLA